MRGVYVNMLVGNKHQHSQVIEKITNKKKQKKLQIYKTRLAYLFKVFSSFISLVVKHSFLYDLAPAYNQKCHLCHLFAKLADTLVETQHYISVLN